MSETRFYVVTAIINKMPKTTGPYYTYEDARHYCSKFFDHVQYSIIAVEDPVWEK